MSVIENTNRDRVKFEKLFLGLLILDPAGVVSKAGYITQDWFVDQQIAQVWQDVKDGQDILVALADADMTTAGLKMMNETPPGTTLTNVVSGMRRGIYFFNVVDTCRNIVMAVEQHDESTVRALADVLRAYDGGTRNNQASSADVAKRLMDRVRQGNITIPTYIASLDYKILGLERGTMSVVAGLPGMGKSALFMEWAEKQSENGQRVGIFSLEMKSESLMARRVCHKMGKTWQDIRAGRISESEIEQLADLVDEYQRTHPNIFWNDATGTTMSEIWQVQQRELYDVIYIDHLGLLKDRHLPNERHDMYLGRLTMQGKDLAKETDCVVVFLHQFNRAGADGDRPTLQNLRDSGRIEQNADNVFLLHREDYFQPGKVIDPNVGSPMEIIIAKMRDGKIGIAYVSFMVDKQTFVSLSKHELETIRQARMETLDIDAATIEADEDILPNMNFWET